MTPKRWLAERRTWKKLTEQGRKGLAAERAAERVKAKTHGQAHVSQA
jgi:hypothetical protein